MRALVDKIRGIPNKPMLVFLWGLGLLAIGAGIFGSSTPTTSVEALGVIGGTVVTRSETDADFTVIKSQGDINNSVQVQASAVNVNLRGQDRNNGTSIAEVGTDALQFLVNTYQPIAEIQAAWPCPSLEEWNNSPDPASEFPTCDPDVLFDPAKCTLFWADIDPAVDHPVIPGETRETQVFRPAFVTLAWDGATYSMRLKDPSRNPADYPNNC